MFLYTLFSDYQDNLLIFLNFHWNMDKAFQNQELDFLYILPRHLFYIFLDLIMGDNILNRG